MDAEALSFQVAAARNGEIRRLVAALAHGTEEVLRDRIDPHSSRARERFAKDLARVVGLDQQALLDRVHLELPRLADAADRQADEAARPDGDCGSENDPFEIGAERLKETPSAIRADAERMARNPDLLTEVYDDLSAMGLAGERELAIACWLVGVSRVLPEPLAAVVIGGTSSGKSYLLRLVGDLFPDEVVVKVTQASPQSWFYMPPGSLRHRFVVLGERPQGDSPEVVDANRSWRELISEGRLTKAVAVKTPEGMATQLVVQEGPVGFCESTTKTRLVDEDASRLVLLNSDDSAEQTSRVLAKMFEAVARPSCVDRQAILFKHHCFQRLIGNPEVVIPFADRLALEFPTERPECRRIARHVLAMVKASAVAHQFQRKRTGEAVMADPADYAVAYRLLKGPAARLLGREPHASVKRLAKVVAERFGDAVFSTNDAAEATGVTPRWAKQGLRWLCEQRYAEEVEPARGPHPAKWRLTGTPSERTVLPTPESVFQYSDFQHSS